MDKMIKIKIAASMLGVSYKTIYNWLEDGSLKLAHPGYVYLKDVEFVQIKKKQEKFDKSQAHSMRFTRDEKGRFKLLSGRMNNKTYKDVD
jgi:excisionase family DNA binding protein